MRGVRAECDSWVGGCRSGEYCVMDGGAYEEGKAGRKVEAESKASGGCYKMENVKVKHKGYES